ncbi:DUF3987 domain-containing protein [uncultured Aquimarina sp.]|uniref:DUF3987 domain-containing protein n=1 Tax=uncultured Aquimarina sp. TaxID=575652 RepID=UPI00260DCCFD|nr:DUF3987 domain-containing protein [uncultured Aquimarina sp.]
MAEFDVRAFLNIQEKTIPNNVNTTPVYNISDTKDAVEQLIQWIETTGTDMTSNYEDWLKIGFALADEFGQIGASYFHRVSKFYSKYKHQECEKQYTQCLNGKRTGVTIGTLFHYAKKAGYVPEKIHSYNSAINNEDKEVALPKKELAEFSTFIFDELPEFLKKVVHTASNSKERDILLLGALTSISACLPNVYGIYDRFTVYPNLFLFVTAPASSGKGRVNLCRRLVNPIHIQKRKETSTEKIQFEVELAEYNQRKSKDNTLVKPNRPLEKMLFIPANSSATGTFELLANNEGVGLIFETEGDTLAQTFKSEHGNYSDGFRKAFHHESISYYRRTDREYVNIECPKLSAVLTGTPNQVRTLMPNSENGLFSRFMFYHMDRQRQWRDVFANDDEEGLDLVFDRLGEEFMIFHSQLRLISNGVKVHFSTEQARRFNEFFRKEYKTFLFLEKNGMEASLFRLGLICFRITMILSVLRMMETENLETVKECEPRDFEIALFMIKTLLAHMESVFLYLPKEKLTLPRQKNIKECFLDELPSQFTTQGYRDISKRLKISQKSAERYIKQFVEKGYLQRKFHGQYLNIIKKK